MSGPSSSTMRERHASTAASSTRTYRDDPPDLFAGMMNYLSDSDSFLKQNRGQIATGSVTVPNIPSTPLSSISTALDRQRNHTNADNQESFRHSGQISSPLSSGRANAADSWLTDQLPSLMHSTSQGMSGPFSQANQALEASSIAGGKLRGDSFHLRYSLDDHEAKRRDIHNALLEEQIRRMSSELQHYKNALGGSAALPQLHDSVPPRAFRSNMTPVIEGVRPQMKTPDAFEPQRMPTMQSLSSILTLLPDGLNAASEPLMGRQLFDNDLGTIQRRAMYPTLQDPIGAAKQAFGAVSSITSVQDHPAPPTRAHRSSSSSVFEASPSHGLQETVTLHLRDRDAVSGRERSQSVAESKASAKQQLLSTSTPESLALASFEHLSTGNSPADLYVGINLHQPSALVPVVSQNAFWTAKGAAEGSKLVQGPSPNNRKTDLYKTELCRSWEEKGYCAYEERCQFAHGPEELRPVQRHPRYKTELCRTYQKTGSCPYAKRCCFRHDEGPADKTAPQMSSPERAQQKPLLARVGVVTDSKGKASDESRPALDTRKPSQVSDRAEATENQKESTAAVQEDNAPRVLIPPKRAHTLTVNQDLADLVKATEHLTLGGSHRRPSQPVPSDLSPRRHGDGFQSLFEHNTTSRAPSKEADNWAPYSVAPTLTSSFPPRSATTPNESPKLTTFNPLDGSKHSRDRAAFILNREAFQTGLPKPLSLATQSSPTSGLSSSMEGSLFFDSSWGPPPRGNLETRMARNSPSLTETTTCSPSIDGSAHERLDGSPARKYD